MNHRWGLLLAVVAGLLLATTDGTRADDALLAASGGLVKCVSDCVMAKGEDYEGSCKIGCAGQAPPPQVDCGANFKGLPQRLQGTVQGRRQGA